MISILKALRDLLQHECLMEFYNILNSPAYSPLLFTILLKPLARPLLALGALRSTFWLATATALWYRTRIVFSHYIHTNTHEELEDIMCQVTYRRGLTRYVRSLQGIPCIWRLSLLGWRYVRRCIITRVKSARVREKSLVPETRQIFWLSKYKW